MLASYSSEHERRAEVQVHPACRSLLLIFALFVHIFYSKWSVVLARLAPGSAKTEVSQQVDRSAAPCHGDTCAAAPSGDSVLVPSPGRQGDTSLFTFPPPLPPNSLLLKTLPTSPGPQPGLVCVQHFPAKIPGGRLSPFGSYHINRR